MELSVISPMSKKTYTIAWIDLPTIIGSIVIQPDHAPTLLILEPKSQVTFERDNGTQESLTISGGIAEVTHKTVTLLLDA